MAQGQAAGQGGSRMTEVVPSIYVVVSEDGWEFLSDPEEDIYSISDGEELDGSG